VPRRNENEKEGTLLVTWRNINCAVVAARLSSQQQRRQRLRRKFSTPSYKLWEKSKWPLIGTKKLVLSLHYYKKG
jgi:hypothetical protein